ncbi:WD_REPEATS_REGION domain-containing protein [Dissophora globulifera]|nr:WD_REPEATS_REGION domain-containing protein [Dissophora globulifera]
MKSTFNKELERELWNDYNNCEDRILKKQKKIPIFVSLPAIDKPEPDLIGRQLRNSHFTKAQIQELKAHRKFVLICDGYDEYQQRRNFYDINQLNRPGQWSAQMVISCRSEYLGNDYRYLFQPEDRDGQLGEALFQEAVIAPFSKERIQTYIEKYVANEAPQWEVKDYLQVFDQFPSLQELVTNPFLLTLSLRVLPNMADLGRNLPSTKVTRIVLYDRFVEQWVDQGKRRLIKRGLVGDDKKAFDILSDDSFSQNAILFVKKLAVAIFENQDGAPVVEYSDQEKGTWKADFFGQDDGKKFLREACPLHRYGNQYRFNHKSLLEYCLARAVFEPQQRGEYRTKGQETPAPERRHEYQGVEKEISVSESASDVKSPLFWKSFVNKPAVLQFLSERVPQEPVFKRQLHSFIEYSKTDKSWCIAAANAITILIRAGVRFNGKDLEGIQIPGADLSGGLFDSAQLQGADLRNVSLGNVWLRQADLSNAWMSEVLFGEWPYLKEESEVHSCAYSPDGRTYTVGLFNGALSVYDTTNWKKIHTFQGYTDNIDSARSVAYSPSSHQIASGGRDFTVQLWDTESGAPGPILRGHTDRINSITYSPRGHQIASGGRDFTVRLWDVQTGVPGLILRGHSETVTSVAYSPSGHQIASGSRDRTVRLWNAQTGESGPILSGHTNIVTSVAYSPIGHQIVSGSRDKTVRLWSTQTGLYGFVLRGHTDIISNVTYSPSGHQIASGGFDKVVRLWDAHTGAPGPILSGHTDHVVGVTYSPNGCQIASGSLDKTVRLWDAQTGVSGPTPSGHTKIVSSVTYSPGGHQIASGSRDKTVRLWDAHTGAPGPILIGHTHAVTSVTYSPSGHQIASGGFDKTVRLWNAHTGAPGPTFSGHTKIITSVVYSPSGYQIASGSWDRTVRLWDAQVFLPGPILSGHSDHVTSVAYSPSGHQIASGSYDKTVQLWDVQTGAPGYILSGHTDVVTAVTYSPSGDRVASGSWDMTVRLWDIQAGASGSILSGHTDIVTSVAYSPNGFQIASRSEDKTVRLWDVDSGRCLVVVQDGAIGSIACSASLSHTYFVTGCDNSVNTWKVIEQEDRYQVRLHWRSIHDRLSLWNTSVQGARGLSNINTQLLRQRSAVI